MSTEAVNGNRNLQFEDDMIQDRISDLRDNTDFAMTLFENVTGYAIMAVDFDGTILAYNDGAQKVYGYAAVEAISKRRFEDFYPRSFVESEAYERAIGSLVEKGRTSFESEKLRRDGETFSAHIVLTSTTDRSGHLVGFVEIAEDLTERRMAEAAQEQASRIAELDRETDSLVRLSNGPGTTVARRMFGGASLIESAPAISCEIMSAYKASLDQALIQRTHKTENLVNKQIREIANRMGRLRSSPRDVIEIHTRSLREQVEFSNDVRKTKALVEEGRLLVLKLMGYLADYYRIRTSSGLESRTTTDSNAPEEEQTHV